ncbi:MAG: hypothetical protein ACK4XJ_08190 [Fimbriimonadaceae bacterium]
MTSLLATLVLATAPLGASSLQPEDWAVRAIPDTKIKLMVPRAYEGKSVPLSEADQKLFESAKTYAFNAGKARLRLWVGKLKPDAKPEWVNEMFAVMDMAKAEPGFKARPGDSRFVEWNGSKEDLRTRFEEENHYYQDTVEPEGVETMINEDYGAADVDGLLDRVTVFMQSAIQKGQVLRLVYIYPEDTVRGTAIPEDHAIMPESDDMSLEEAWASHLEYWYWEEEARIRARR